MTRCEDAGCFWRSRDRCRRNEAYRTVGHATAPSASDTAACMSAHARPPTKRNRIIARRRSSGGRRSGRRRGSPTTAPSGAAARQLRHRPGEERELPEARKVLVGDAERARRLLREDARDGTSHHLRARHERVRHALGADGAQPRHPRMRMGIASSWFAVAITTSSPSAKTTFGMCQRSARVTPLAEVAEHEEELRRRRRARTRRSSRTCSAIAPAAGSGGRASSLAPSRRSRAVRSRRRSPRQSRGRPLRRARRARRRRSRRSSRRWGRARRPRASTQVVVLPAVAFVAQSGVCCNRYVLKASPLLLGAIANANMNQSGKKTRSRLIVAHVARAVSLTRAQPPAAAARAGAAASRTASHRAGAAPAPRHRARRRSCDDTPRNWGSTPERTVPTRPPKAKVSWHVVCSLPTCAPRSRATLSTMSASQITSDAHLPHRHRELLRGDRRQHRRVVDQPEEEQPPPCRKRPISR